MSYAHQLSSSSSKLDFSFPTKFNSPISDLPDLTSPNFFRKIYSIPTLEPQINWSYFLRGWWWCFDKLQCSWKDTGPEASVVTRMIFMETHQHSSFLPKFFSFAATVSLLKTTTKMSFYRVFQKNFSVQYFHLGRYIEQFRSFFIIKNPL